MDGRAAEWSRHRKLRPSHLVRCGRLRAARTGVGANRRRRALVFPYGLSLVSEERAASPTSSCEHNEHEAQQSDTKHEDNPTFRTRARHDDSMADAATASQISGSRGTVANGSRGPVARLLPARVARRPARSVDRCAGPTWRSTVTTDRRAAPSTSPGLGVTHQVLTCRFSAWSQTLGRSGRPRQ